MNFTDLIGKKKQLNKNQSMIASFSRRESLKKMESFFGTKAKKEMDMNEFFGTTKNKTKRKMELEKEMDNFFG
jgi:hypothetical protein